MAFSFSGLPPSNRADDFYVVAGLEDVRVVTRTRDEFCINFNGNPALFQHHLRNQGADRCPFRDFLSGTVYEDLHDLPPTGK